MHEIPRTISYRLRYVHNICAYACLYYTNSQVNVNKCETSPTQGLRWNNNGNNNNNGSSSNDNNTSIDTIAAATSTEY